MNNAGLHLPAPALALESAAGFEGPNITWYLITCAVVIGAIFGVGWLLRRLCSGSLRNRAAKRALQILDVLPLGGKQRLVVVRCYDRSFLLGVGEKEVSAITELDADETLTPPGEETEQIKAVHPVANLDAFEDLLGETVKPVAPKVTTPPTRAGVLEGGRGVLG